jgi:hypothetical protein
MRNGGDKLRWRERLRQHDAVRDVLRRPIVNIFSAHINDGKVWIDFSGMSSDNPAVNLISSKIDVGNKGSVFSDASSNSTALSPDEAMTVSNPPSVRHSSTTLWTRWSSSTTKITNGFSNFLLPTAKKAAITKSRGSEAFVPTEMFKSELRHRCHKPAARSQ